MGRSNKAQLDYENLSNIQVVKYANTIDSGTFTREVNEIIGLETRKGSVTT